MPQSEMNDREHLHAVRRRVRRQRLRAGVRTFGPWVLMAYPLAMLSVLNRYPYLVTVLLCVATTLAWAFLMQRAMRASK